MGAQVGADPHVQSGGSYGQPPSTGIGAMTAKKPSSGDMEDTGLQARLEAVYSWAVFGGSARLNWDRF